MGNDPPKRTCLYIDMAYSIEELRTRAHFQFFEARHSNGYFENVIGLHPLADRVVALNAAIERHKFSVRQDVIEAKSTAFGLPKWLAPIDLFLSQRRLLHHVAEIIRKENVAVIQATDPLYGGLFALRLRRLTRVPVVIHLVANFDLNYEATGSLAMPRMFPTHAIERAVIRFVLKRADLVAAGSETLRDYAVAQGARADRTTVFRVSKNMVPAHRVHPSRRAGLSNDEKAELGIQDCRKLLLTVARLEPVKMVDDSVRALSVVVQRHPDALLLLAGQGSERQRLEALAEKLGVARRVRFLGLISQDLLARLAPGCIALSPLTGMALFETSMAGCPAIAYDCDSAVNEMVETGKTGTVIEPGDWAAMGRAASALFDDPAELARQSAAIRERAVRLTDEQALYAHEHSVFDRLLSN